MGSSSGGGDSETTVRYADYWESAHKNALNLSGSQTLTTSVYGAINSALGSSPYAEAVDINVRGGFFSTGYVVEDFPALWDMFGKFMAGLDVHLLWEQTFDGIVSSPQINDAVDAQAAYLDDDLETNVLPRFEAGMRDIGAVHSSAFAIGRAVIEDTRTKAVNKFASELRLRALDSSVEMWKSHLGWNANVIATYSNMYKLYYAVEMDVNAQDMDMQERGIKFDLGLFEYARSMLGVVSGAQGTVESEGPSSTQTALSGLAGGAAIGAQVGGVGGAVVGGIIGLGASFL